MGSWDLANRFPLYFKLFEYLHYKCQCPEVHEQFIVEELVTKTKSLNIVNEHYKAKYKVKVITDVLRLPLIEFEL